MIKLYKNAEKNEKIKAVIADLRKTSRPFSFKYYCMYVPSSYSASNAEKGEKS